MDILIKIPKALSSLKCTEIHNRVLNICKLDERSELRPKEDRGFIIIIFYSFERFS